MRALLLLPVLAGCAKDPTVESVAPPTAPASFCAENGWTERAFLTEAAFGSLRRDVAADFTVSTTDGDWTFSEQFSGCESYVFVPDSLVISPLDPTPLLDSRKDLKQLLDESPANVHWFFVSAATSKPDVNAFADAMVDRVAGALDSMSDANQAWWAPRLHVIDQGVDDLDGWLPEAITAATPGFAIDRFQRLRDLGSLADVTRYSSALNSAGYWPWDNNLAYIAHEPQYFEYEAAREDMLAATDWTVLQLWYEEDIAANGRDQVAVALPEAAAMAGFDTLLVDLSHVCDPTSMEWGNCDAWDAIEHLWLCDVDDPDDCGIELARYITTYHREGRWLADGSMLLPYLRDGGTRTFKLSGTRSGHFNSVRLLLGNTDKGAVPFAAEHLWEGGTWNADYNANHPPIQVAIPADATRVYLQATVSGHGMSAGDNCAEFCDHHHIFGVGGAEFVAEHPDIADQEGCLKQVGDGTVPNQYGTWFYDRSSWCPGKQVDPWVWDITDQVVPGQTAELTYTTNWNDPVQDGSIVLQTWISFWK